MVLLSGLNYNYASQQMTILTAQIGIGSTIIKVQNTEGFVDDDYFVIDPKSENAEIIKITTKDDDFTFTSAAAKFKHAIGTKLFRLPYNQMRFYDCADAFGTYLLIVGSTTEMSYANIFTNYNYPSGSGALYYKRTFYNETTLVESEIAEADYWQTNDEKLYISPEELRVFLQFDENDYPNPKDMASLIKIAQKQIDLDVNTSNPNILYLASMMLSKFYVLRALATKSLAKGYISINVDGRNITKASQELVLDAENTLKEYQAFVRNNTRSETGQTNFMDDTTLVDPETRAAIIDNWTGTSNAMQEGYPQGNLYGTRRRLR